MWQHLGLDRVLLVQSDRGWMRCPSPCCPGWLCSPVCHFPSLLQWLTHVQLLLLSTKLQLSQTVPGWDCSMFYSAMENSCMFALNFVRFLSAHFSFLLIFLRKAGNSPVYHLLFSVWCYVKPCWQCSLNNHSGYWWRCKTALTPLSTLYEYRK